jgi:hypothetical protein
MSDLPKIDFDESRLHDWPDHEPDTCTPWEQMGYWLTWAGVVVFLCIVVIVVGFTTGYVIERLAS